MRQGGDSVVKSDATGLGGSPQAPGNACDGFVCLPPTALCKCTAHCSPHYTVQWGMLLWWAHVFQQQGNRLDQCGCFLMRCRLLLRLCREVLLGHRLKLRAKQLHAGLHARLIVAVRAL